MRQFTISRGFLFLLSLLADAEGEMDERGTGSIVNPQIMGKTDLTPFLLEAMTVAMSEGRTSPDRITVLSSCF